MEHELARLKHSRVKGHHIFQSSSRPGDTFNCAREPSNAYSQDAIIVKRNGSNVGNVPDPLCQCFGTHDGLWYDSTHGWNYPRSASEGVWIHGGGIDIPCENVHYGSKMYRQDVRRSLWETQMSSKGGDIRD